MEQEIKTNYHSDLVTHEIKLMNEMLKIATEHGGDPGGPYFSCTADLKVKVDEWLVYKEYARYYESYIAENEYIQIRPRALHAVEPVEEGFEGFKPGENASMPNIYSNRGKLFVIMMTTSQMMYERCSKLISLSWQIADGRSLCTLSPDEVIDIIVKIKDANRVYEKALYEVMNTSCSAIADFKLDSLNRDMRSYSLTGFRFGFNTREDAMIFIDKISDLLDNAQSLTVAELKKLYGIESSDIHDEKRGWRGDIKISLDMITNRSFYYVTIHDDPFESF